MATTRINRHKRILELLQTPSEKRDINWLQTSLNSAIELELATLPPYLSAWWSIKDSSQQAAQLIHSVIIEEMLHLGLAANMLTTIQGTPQINTVLPTYPGPLPGGVRPQLTVYLAGLTQEYLTDVFMQIEYPENGPIVRYLGESYPTIGAFYDAILAAFKELQPTFTGNNQQVGTLGLYPILSLGDVEKAISQIKEQGEGSSQSPEATDFGGELAHYYKFAEIYHGRELIQVDGKWQYSGNPIPFPETYPVARVPEGGWPNASQDVQELLRQFNATFKDLLDKLQATWITGSEDPLNEAIGDMFQLTSQAKQIVQIPLPDGSGNYCPDFLIYS